MWEIKTTTVEIENAFYGLINRLNMAEERISELEDKRIVLKLKINQNKQKHWGEKKPEQNTKYYGTITKV